MSVTSTSVSSPVKQNHYLLRRLEDQVCPGHSVLARLSQPLCHCPRSSALCHSVKSILSTTRLFPAGCLFSPGFSWACCNGGTRLMLWSIPLSIWNHSFIHSLVHNAMHNQQPVLRALENKERVPTVLIFGPRPHPQPVAFCQGGIFKKSLGLIGEGMCGLQGFIYLFFLTASEKCTGPQPPAL